MEDSDCVIAFILVKLNYFYTIQRQPYKSDGLSKNHLYDR